MKKLFLLLCIFILQGFHSVEAFNVTMIDNKITSCPGANVSDIIYIDGDNISQGMMDEYWSSDPRVISKNSSDIRIWQSDTSLVSSCLNSDNWQWLSSYSPGSNQRVIAFGANCTFHKPTDKNNRYVQFVYNVGNFRIQQGGSDSYNLWSRTLSQVYSSQRTDHSLNNVTLTNFQKHANECHNIELRYCGDGIVSHGEVCDPEDPNQVGWGNGGCDANTCQPINTPSCNGLTVNPNSGDAPLNVTATCEGFRVNTWQIDCGNGQTFSGTGNNSGTQTFQRTCNYTTAGNYTPRCTINGSITNNSCRKTVNVTTPLNPSIVIDKRDANVHDLDGNVGNDTQTVYKGEKAVFKIRVTNNGNETLRDIRLTDPRAPACATRGSTTVDLKNNRFTNSNNQTITITPGGSGNKNDNRLEPGEWFEYTCEHPNSQSNYTNTAGTTGVGITTGRTVSDTDPTQIIVIERPNPRIEVDKRDANPDDLDGNIGGNDSQTVNPGDKAVFSITVTNNGEEDLKDIVLIDEMAPACATADGTFVDLRNKRFINQLGQRVNIQFTGLGNHSNNILEVGEKFFYTCEKGNTQENYTNVVIVRGTGVSSNQTVTDDDSTAVVVERNPSIQVIKLDANPNDLDRVQFNDTQTVLRGTEAIFDIRVVNNGNEALKDIKLIDPVAPACATVDGTFVDLRNKRFTNKLGQVVTIYLDGQGNHNNATFEVGEEFSYTCAKDNTQDNYTNTVDVEGTGITSGTTVTDRDTTVVIVADREPKISIDKTDANPDDLDGIEGNDTQTVEKGDTAVFQITVSNTGSEPLKNVRLIDEKAPACATADGTFVDFVNTRFTNKLGNVVQIDLVNISIGIGGNDEFKTGAVFRYICEAGDTQNDYTNTVRVDAIGVDTNQDVSDDDDTIILIRSTPSDVVLIKSKAPGQSEIVAPGERVHYVLTIRNRGTQAANNYKVEDHYPLGLVLDDNNWTNVAGMTRVARYNQLLNIPAGGEIRINIYFRVALSFTDGSLRNLAVVCPDDNPNCPQICPPDAPTRPCDDDEEEEDPCGCEIVRVSACTGLTSTVSSAQNSLTTTLTCIGTQNANTFRIEVRNPSGALVNTINDASGEVTLPLIGNSDTSYRASCFVNDEDTAIPACQTTLNVTRGGGGGSNHSCVDIEQRNAITVRCTGLSANVMGITYTSSGSTMQQKKDNLSTTGAGRVYADFTLPADATNIQCLASKNGLEPIAEGLQDWRGGLQCRFRTSECGNGVIDPGEQCDFGAPFTPERWGSCGLPGTANACRLGGGGGGTPPPVDCSAPGISCGVITIPDEGVFRFGPSGSVVVGYNQYPLAQNPHAIYGYPVLINDSRYDISFQEFCIKSRDNTLVVAQNPNTGIIGEICVNIENRKIYPYEELYLVRDGTNYKVVNQYHSLITDPNSHHNYEHFKVVPNSVQSGDYRDTQLVTSVKDTLPLSGGGSQQFAFYDTFLAANLNVRVARPAVTTVGGGTSFVKSTTTSDVAKITSGFGTFTPGRNVNFVGTSVSESGISSDTAVITDTGASSGDGRLQGGIDLITTVTHTQFKKYNNLDNVYIKSGNHTFSGTPSGNGSRTYIVENGDVIISQNLISSDNIAIIVRNGNITINSNVERIDATLMTLDGGKITGVSSGKQLRVNGALYGNIDELVENRYFIDGSGSTLSVGTIVSFGSNLLRKPAPLLSQFVGEYLRSQRVAR